MQCKTCRDYITVTEGTTAVRCGVCVGRSMPWPKMYTPYKSSGRPRGWKWMSEFVDKDGNVFHKGIEQPKLKNTLNPTIIKPLKKKKKVDKDSRMFANAKVYKEKQKLKRALNKQKDFLDGKVKS